MCTGEIYFVKCITTHICLSEIYTLIRIFYKWVNNKRTSYLFGPGVLNFSTVWAIGGWKLLVVSDLLKSSLEMRWDFSL